MEAGEGQICMMLVWIYIAGDVVSAYLISGMAFSGLHMIGPESLARRYLRGDLPCAVIGGILVGLTWPVGLPATFLMTGFAKHGIWRFRWDCRGARRVQ